MSEGLQKLSSLPVASSFDRLLKVEDPAGEVSHFPLVGDRIIIGRQEGVDLMLPHVSVSRRHAELRCDRWGKWWLRDLGSSNGTLINGFASTERLLDLADRITIGQFHLTLTLPSEAMQDSSLAGGPAIAVRETSVTAKSMSALREDSRAEARLSALQLTQLMELSKTLHAADRLSQRMRLLCQLMVNDQFRCFAATIIRLARTDAAAAPQTLCSPVMSPQFGQRSLFIANSLLKALRQKPEPTLARESEIATAGATLAGVAAMACPLRHDEQSIDLLYIILPPQLANEEWLTLASLAAEHFRQAENGWAARRLAKVSALVEVDLQRARDIQMRLVPRDVQVQGLEVALGFQPCRWVAGDYVDVLTLRHGKTLLVVADVCGKGMPAALVSSSVHTLVHASIGAGADLLQTATLLNDHLLQYLPRNRFVTGILIEIDPATGQMNFINAGHPSPIVIDPTGQRRLLDAGPYEPFGLQKRTYDLLTDQLNPSQLLAMFTDGLSEARDQQGKMLTVTRLGETLSQIHQTTQHQPLQLAADQLNHVLDEYQGHNLQGDDRTFLLTRRPLGAGEHANAGQGI